MFNSSRLRAVFLCLLVSLLSACGGGGASDATVATPATAVSTPTTTVANTTTTTQEANTTTAAGATTTTVASTTTTTAAFNPLIVDVSLAHVGDQIVYADANWAIQGGQSNVNAWVSHGTMETPSFGPDSFYQDSGGYTNSVAWWTDTETWSSTYQPAGLLISSSPPGNGLYNASLLNVGVSGVVYISQHPVIDISYVIPVFTGSRARATVGVTLQDPAGSIYYVEQELEGRFDLCANSEYDRCTGNITYFPPTTPGPIDIRALLLRAPNITAAYADSLKIVGVYVGSEIFDAGRVDLLVTDFHIMAQVQ